MKSKEETKVAIIGAGVNGLTCAAYLAKAGFQVTVFEKNQQAGGLCVNQTPFKNSAIKVSAVASYYGMLREEVAEELGLYERGLTPYLTDPIEIVLLKDRQYVYYPREGSADMQAEETTEEDKKGWVDFWTDIQRAAQIVYPHYLKPITAKEYLEALKQAGLDKIAETIYTGSLFDLADKYFQSPALKAVAATCTPGFANLVGSVFGCIHHGTASTLGNFGAWGQVKGGMGKITEAILQRATECGAKIKTGLGIKSINIEGESVGTIVSEDGQEHRFDLVIMSGDPYTLFEKLIDCELVPSGIRAYLAANRPRVSAAKLHYLLKKQVNFETLERIGHNHKGVLVIAPTPEAVKQASRAVPEGNLPEELMLTMAYPTLEDESIYGEEKNKDRHVLTVDVHYLPAQLKGKNGLRPWQKEDDETLSRAVLNTIEKYAPGFTEQVEESYIVSPGGLKSLFNNESLSCWHMPMSQDFLFENRALPTLPHYHTPFANLYLCGSGTFPGGNVTGANGHNLAKLLINAYSPALTPTSAK